MKRGALLILVLALVVVLYAAITVGNHTAAINTTTTTAVTSGIDTSGNSLIALCLQDINATLNTVSDSKGNTISLLTEQASGGLNAHSLIGYLQNPTVGTGHTFTLTAPGTGDYPGLAVIGWNGAKTSGVFDQQNGAVQSSGSATTIQAGSITPTEDNEVVVACVSWANTTATPTIDSGFTITDRAEALAALGLSMAYKIQTTAAAVNPTWTVSTGQYMAATIASFKQAAAGPGASRQTVIGGGYYE